MTSPDPIQKHTPLPWRLSAGEEFTSIVHESGDPFPLLLKIFGFYDPARRHEDAAFIVRACNEYYDLKAIADELLENLKICMNEMPDRCETERENARAAIKKAQP